MPHTFSYNSTEHLIEAKVEGSFNLVELETFVKELAAFSIEKKCYQHLSDFRAAHIKFSTVELYDLPQKIKSLLDPAKVDLSSFKRALVIANDVDDFKFFETVTLNRGQEVKLFYDLESAKQWLLEKE
jgi:hypothetical protein